MSKIRQREKHKARRARRDHGLKTEATAASRPRRRRARAAIGVVSALGILFLGTLGTALVAGMGDSPEEEATTEAPSDPDAPPCPEPDGSSPRRTQFNAPPAMCIDPDASYQARVVTTAGAFLADLDPQRSPLAVNNFVFLARYHFYEDLPFHRVVPNFYAQTGDPVARDLVGPGYVFPDDPLPPLGTYQLGSLVFAHEDKDQNGSQFLIFLDPEVSQIPHVFPLFGQVTQGLGTLEKIEADGGTAQDPSPDTPHRIERIDIIETP